MNHDIKIALYAGTGGRKTLQIGSLIKALGGENVGIISCESGLRTIGSLVNQEMVKEVENIKELAAAFDWAKEKFTKPDQWVCVDGGSRVLQWYSEHWWGGVQTAYEKILGGIDAKSLPPDIRKFAVYITGRDGINSQQIWIRMAAEITALFNKFVKLPSSMYWTFWEEMTNVDQYTKGLPWKPDTPGKGAFDAIKGTFDFIGRLENSGESCKATFDPSSKAAYAKCRDDWGAGIRVPKIIEAFDLADFVHRVSGKGWGDEK